jgi:hypothetical protein
VVNHVPSDFQMHFDIQPLKVTTVQMVTPMLCRISSFLNVGAPQRGPGLLYNDSSQSEMAEISMRTLQDMCFVKGIILLFVEAS